MPNYILSKSSYIRSLQCLKSLYFYKFHYKERDPITVEQQARFERGHRYGRLAHLLFPGGIDVSPPTPYDYSPSVARTQQLLMKQQSVIYEAAFVGDEVVVALDILVKKSGALHAFEVKSSVRISETILNDAALQYYVITKAGFALEDFTIIHLKPDYKEMNADDVPSLFINESVLDFCKSKFDFVSEKIEEAKSIIKNKRIPEIAQGEQCTTPFPCDYKNICTKSNKFETGSLFG